MISTCTAIYCAYVVVKFSGFTAGSHTVGCYADDPYPYDIVDAFYTYSTSSTTSAVPAVAFVLTAAAVGTGLTRRRRRLRAVQSGRA
jgi:hypothetical protein